MKRLSIKIPTAVVKPLLAQAKKNRRSQNAEIGFILEEALVKQEVKP